MLKIFHISDLHFCVPDLAARLKEAVQLINRRITPLLEGKGLDIHIASDDILDALADEISRQDPDVVVVSGDLTAFGDQKSFGRFGDWSRNLASRPAGRGTRRWIVVPGNHDVLKSHLTFLYREDLRSLPLPAPLRYWLRRSARNHLRSIRDFLDERWDDEHYLMAFRDLIEKYPHLTSATVAIQVPGCPGVTVRIIPFATPSCDPVWMNLGETRRRDWENFKNEVEGGSDNGSSLKFVVLHHNPLAAPSGKNGRFPYAYNGMPEGTEFLRELQDAGVDLILYGHQHEYTLLRFDLEVQDKGHAFALGSDSSSSNSGGFNLISVLDPNNAQVDRFRYKARRGLFRGSREPVVLHLERNRPVHPLTLSARYELKQYRYPSNDAVDEIVFGPVKERCDGIVYMSGRHFRSERLSEFQGLRRVLDTKSGKIRFVQVDPALVRALAQAERSTTSGTGDGDLWGRTEALANLAAEADYTLKEIEQFVDGLTEEEATRIDVRVAHTLLPFGAYVRDPDKNWGSMAVKALPVGAIGDIPAPVFRLNRRTDQALFDYYLRYLKYLFLRSRRMFGRWVDEADLRQGMTEDILSLLPGRATEHSEGLR